MLKARKKSTITSYYSMKMRGFYNGSILPEKIRENSTFNALFLSSGNISLDASSRAKTKRSYLRDSICVTLG